MNKIGYSTYSITGVEYIIMYRGIIQRQYCGLQNRSRGFESLFPCFSSPESLNNDVGFWDFCFVKCEKKLENISPVSYNMAGSIRGETQEIREVIGLLQKLMK